MKPKRLSLLPNLPHRKSPFLVSSGEQILVKIKTICSQQDKFGNDFKTFWFRFQNDIQTFLLLFLTLLDLSILPIGVQFIKYELGEERYYIKILILVVTNLGLGFIRLIMLGPAGSPGRARKLFGELHVVNKLDA
jgi:hypothetical protein